MSSSQNAAVTPAADDGDRSGRVIACAVVMTAVAAVTVGLRFYVRGKLLRTLKSEDWCILLALLFSITAAASVIEEGRHGLGRHFVTITPEEVRGYWKSSYFDTISYNLSLCCTKLSILLLYLRVLTPEYIRKVIWGAFALVAVYNVWALAMELTICIPLRKMWDSTVPGYCHPTSVWWALTYLHIASDFILFLLPTPVVVTMTIPTRQKAGLLFVFTLGLFVCLISVVRTVILNQLLDSKDPTWDLVVIANWTSAETNAAIICACMPTLRPVLAALLKRLFPHLDQSQEEPSDGRPKTIGSLPIRAFRFGQGSGNNQPSLPTESDSSWALTNGGTVSVTTIETHRGEDLRLEGGSKPASNVDGNPSDLELESGLAAPARVLVKTLK